MTGTACWSISSGYCGNGDGQFMQMACCESGEDGKCVGDSWVDDDLPCKQWITKHFTNVSAATAFLNAEGIVDAKIIQGASASGIDVLYRGFVRTGKRTPLKTWKHQRDPSYFTNSAIKDLK